MKRVMIDVGHRLLSLNVMIDADIPHRRLGATHQNQKQTLSDFRFCPVFFRRVVLAFTDRTIHNRNAVGFRIPANATAEAGRHAHQVSVSQHGISTTMPMATCLYAITSFLCGFFFAFLASWREIYTGSQ